MMNTTITTIETINAAFYKELQSMAKMHKIKANQKADALREALIALIPVTFFFTQLVVDIFCAKFVDRIGYRVSIVASEAFSALGLISLAFLPEIFPSEKAFTGIINNILICIVNHILFEVFI